MTVPAELVTDIGGESVGGEGGVSAAAVAKDMAAIIAAGMKSEPAAGTTQPAAQPAAVVAPTKATEPVAGQEAAAAVEEAPAGAEEPASPTDEELAATESALLEIGVDLGLTHVDVPAELRPAYDRIVGSVVEVVQSSLQREVEANDAIRQVNDFRERLEADPQKILLTMALNKPEQFNAAMQVFTRMQQEPEFKELVVKELQAEAKFRAADQKEKSLGQQMRTIKGRQAAAITRQAARRYSVPVETAESVVAAHVKGGGGDLELSAIEGIVKALAPKNLVARPRVASIIKAKVVAPTQPVAAAAPPPAATTASPGLNDGSNRKGGGGGFRSLVREALARATPGAER